MANPVLLVGMIGSLLGVGLGTTVIARATRAAWTSAMGPTMTPTAWRWMYGALLAVTLLWLPTVTFAGLGPPWGGLLTAVILALALDQALRPLCATGNEPIAPTEPTGFERTHDGFWFPASSKSAWPCALLLAASALTCGMGLVLMGAWAVLPAAPVLVRVRNGLLSVGATEEPLDLHGATVARWDRWDGTPFVRVTGASGRTSDVPLAGCSAGETEWIRSALAEAAHAARPAVEPSASDRDHLAALRATAARQSERG